MTELRYNSQEKLIIIDEYNQKYEVKKDEFGTLFLRAFK